MSLPLAQAYLEQARADYSSYTIIRQTPQQSSSQWLHLLQMTLEKTAKAYLAASGDDFDRLRESHRAFGRFIRILPRNRGVRANLNMDATQLQRHIQNLKPLVDDLERLVPGRDNQGPTAEYPWRNPHGGFHSPCLYDFDDIISGLDTVRGRNLLRILERGLEDAT
jgi:hypothetical protein